MHTQMDIPRGQEQAASGFVPLDPLNPRTPAPSPASDEALYAKAEGLALRTAFGCPYAGMNMQVYKGEVTALRGRNGSGKTALLLTMAGRMAHTDGTLSILGQTMPKNHGKVQRRVGLALVDGINDIQENLTVYSVTASEFSLYGIKKKREDIMAFLEEWGLGTVAHSKVRDLSRERHVLLGIALGLVNNPQALAVDDIEDQLTRVQSERLMGKLLQVAHDRRIAVMVACTERSLAQMADRVYHLG